MEKLGASARLSETTMRSAFDAVILWLRSNGASRPRINLTRRFSQGRGQTRC